MAASTNSVVIKMTMNYKMGTGGNKSSNKTVVLSKYTTDNITGHFTTSIKTDMKRHFQRSWIPISVGHL